MDVNFIKLNKTATKICNNIKITFIASILLAYLSNVIMYVIQIVTQMLTQTLIEIRQ